MPRLDIDLAANVARMQRDMQRATGIVEKSFGDMRRAAGTVKNLLSFAGVGLSLGGVVAGFREIIDKAAEAERIEGKVQAVIRATGSAAGLTSKELFGMADGLAKITRFDDEQIKDAMSVLLTFPDVSGKNFQRAIGFVADLAARMGGDLPGAALLMGKALSMPTEALGALERSVGKFTPHQKELIDGFEKSGDLAKAQDVIFGKLQGSIGGVAAGENTGLTKATGDLAKAWDEMLEAIGRTPTVQAGAKTTFGALTFLLNAIKGKTEESRTELEKLLKLPPPPSFKGPIFKGGGFEGTLADAEEIARARAAEREHAREREQERVAAKVKKDFDEIAKLRFDTFDKDRAAIDKEAEAVDALKDSIDPLRVLNKEMTELDRIKDRLDWDQYAEATFDAFDKANKAIEDHEKVGEDSFAALEAAARGWGDEFTHTLAAMVTTGKLNFKSLAESILNDLARIAIFQNITKPLFASLGVPGFAHGGRHAGGLAIVGERGPELIASGPARVFNAQQTQKLIAGSGAGTVVNVIDQRGAGAPAVDINRSTGADGRELVSVLVRGEVQRMIGDGSIDRSMRRTYGLARQGG